MKITSKHPKIVVVGSCSIDLLLFANQRPQTGQTVIAKRSETFFGGKGASEAIACSRLGASVYFIGCVGMDPFGQQILRNLVQERVNVGFVHEDMNCETGTAYANVADGIITTMVVPAANYCLKPKHLYSAERVISTADFVLTQLEIPMDVVEETVRICKKHGVKFGIYAAPGQKLSQEVIEYASIIVAKTDCLPIIFEEEDLNTLLQKYPNKLFLRDGTNSTVYYTGAEMKFFRNDPAEVANKMGMSDAFTAGLTVALLHGNQVEESVKFGNDVSLKVASNQGSQRGLPYLSDFNF